MPKKGRKPSRRGRSEAILSWLPIDNRFIPDIFSFGHVKGAARFFLITEMILAVGVVIGSFVLVCLKCFPK